MAETVVVPKGMSSSEIAERLEHEGVIASRWAFMINYLFQSRFGPKPIALRHGEYMFKQGASIHEVLDILSEGKSVAYKVTIPEGLTSHQIVERLKEEENLTGEVAEVPAERLTAAETYSIEKGMARQELLQIMQAKQKQALDAVWERRQQELPFKSAEEAVVLASIIEKETGRSDERDRIAGVFINRLQKGCRCSPTRPSSTASTAARFSGANPSCSPRRTPRTPTTPIRSKACHRRPSATQADPHSKPRLRRQKPTTSSSSPTATGGHIFTATLEGSQRCRAELAQVRERTCGAEARKTQATSRTTADDYSKSAGRSRSRAGSSGGSGPSCSGSGTGLDTCRCQYESPKSSASRLSGTHTPRPGTPEAWNSGCVNHRRGGLARRT